MLFEPSQKMVALKDKLLSFMHRHIYPNEARFYKEAEKLGPWKVYPVIEEPAQETNMASTAEDRMAGSTDSDAEVAAGRAARDDLPGDLNKLRKDVAVIRNTVAEIARIVASQAGEPAAHPRSDIAVDAQRKVRHHDGVRTSRRDPSPAFSYFRYRGSARVAEISLRQPAGVHNFV